jgi:hypothetical protein
MTYRTWQAVSAPQMTYRTWYVILLHLPLSLLSYLTWT